MKPKTPKEYAKYLYMAWDCDGAVQTMRDHDIIDARVRAFVDGVKWARRQDAKKRRSVSISTATNVTE